MIVRNTPLTSIYFDDPPVGGDDLAAAAAVLEPPQEQPPQDQAPPPESAPPQDQAPPPEPATEPEPDPSLSSLPPDQLFQRLSGLEKQNRELKQALKQQPASTPEEVLKQAGITADQAFDMLMKDIDDEPPTAKEDVPVHVQRVIDEQSQRLKQMEQMIQQQSLFREVDAMAATVGRDSEDRWELCRAMGDGAYEMAVRVGYQLMQTEGKPPSRETVLDKVEEHLQSTYERQLKSLQGTKKFGNLFGSPAPEAPTAASPEPTLTPKDSDTPKPADTEDESVLMALAKAELDK